MMGIDRDGTVFSVHVHGERLSYRVRRFRTDAVIHSLFTFGTSMLAFGEDASVYELDTDNDTLRRVDLAGHGLRLAAYPKQDLVTGELHLVADDTAGGQAHVVVSAGAMTRRSRPVRGASSRIKDVALSRDHAVFVADGFIGIAPRDGGESRTTWIATGAAAPRPLHAHDSGNAVALLVLTPSVETWTLHPVTGTIERAVLDDAPRRFAHLRTDAAEGAPNLLWTTGEQTIARHDLVNSHHTHHSLQPHLPGDFVIVPDATRSGDANGGWLVGLVRNSPNTTTDLLVSDATDIAAPAVATARIPTPIPLGRLCTWIPSTHH